MQSCSSSRLSSTLYKPDIYQRIVEDFDVDQNIPGANRVSSYVPWIVYSMESDAMVVSSPNDMKSTTSSVLPYHESFFVIDQSSDSDWLELAKGNLSANNKFEKQGKENVYVGWVQKKDLLLWDRAIYDKTSRFTIMAIAKVNASHDDGRHQAIRVYNDSGSSESVEFLNTSPLYYIMANKNGRLLLSLSERLYENSVRTELIGWVSEDDVHIWRNRSYIYPSDSCDVIQFAEADELGPKEDFILYNEYFEENTSDFMFPLILDHTGLDQKVCFEGKELDIHLQTACDRDVLRKGVLLNQKEYRVYLESLELLSSLSSRSTEDIKVKSLDALVELYAFFTDQGDGNSAVIDASFTLGDLRSLIVGQPRFIYAPIDFKLSNLASGNKVKRAELDIFIENCSRIRAILSDFEGDRSCKNCLSYIVDTEEYRFYWIPDTLIL